MAHNAVPVGAFCASTGTLVQCFESVRVAASTFAINYAHMQQLLNTGKQHKGSGMVFKRLRDGKRRRRDLDANSDNGDGDDDGNGGDDDGNGGKDDGDDGDGGDSEASRAAETLAGWRTGDATTANNATTAALLAYQSKIICERDAVIQQQQAIIQQQAALLTLAAATLWPRPTA